MAHPHAAGVIDESQKEIAMEVEAGQLLESRKIVWALSKAVEHVELEGNPGQSRLDQHDPEIGEALQRAGQDPEAERFGQRGAWQRIVDAFLRSGIAQVHVAQR